MSKTLINVKDDTSSNMHDAVNITGGHAMRGAVEVYEKNGDDLKLIREKHNLIVYGGREWLMKRAFGAAADSNSSEIYNSNLKWFALGQGGGEPGNPLQAGSTLGSDSELLSMTRLRNDLTTDDVAYSLYGSDVTTGDHGYYKKFSSVVFKEDHANPYTEDSTVKYPSIIAEIRIELSSDDGNGDGGWTDINEAGLFVSSDSTDPGVDVEADSTIINDMAITQTIIDGDYTLYYLDSNSLTTDNPNLSVGDYLWTTRSDSSEDNVISESAPLTIVDMYSGETSRSAYIVVQNENASIEDFGGSTSPLTAKFIAKDILPYTMFSRVTFSTIRKTVDREIVFLWKIYF